MLESQREKEFLTRSPSRESGPAHKLHCQKNILYGKWKIEFINCSHNLYTNTENGATNPCLIHMIQAMGFKTLYFMKNNSAICWKITWNKNTLIAYCEMRSSQICWLFMRAVEYWRKNQDTTKTSKGWFVWDSWTVFPCSGHRCSSLDIAINEVISPITWPAFYFKDQNSSPSEGSGQASKIRKWRRRRRNSWEPFWFQFIKLVPCGKITLKYYRWFRRKGGRGNGCNIQPPHPQHARSKS